MTETVADDLVPSVKGEPRVIAAAKRLKQEEAKFRLIQRENRVVDYHDFYQDVMKKWAARPPAPIRNTIIDIIARGGFGGDYAASSKALGKLRNRVQVKVIQVQYDEAIRDCDQLTRVLREWREFEEKNG